jgi:hypothetical protein
MAVMAKNSSANRLEATYEPSAIFGAFKPKAKDSHILGPVKPTAQEVLKRPKPGSKQSRSKVKPTKAEKPPTELTEDEKQVSLPY